MQARPLAHFDQRGRNSAPARIDASGIAGVANGFARHGAVLRRNSGTSSPSSAGGETVGSRAFSSSISVRSARFSRRRQAFVFEFFVTRAQALGLAAAVGADVVARFRLARRFRFCLSCLPLRGARGLRCRCLFHRLLTRLAVLANALLNWGDFPSCFLLRTDRLMVGLDRLADLPVGLARIGLEQLGDQLALLPGGQMPPENIA